MAVTLVGSVGNVLDTATTGSVTGAYGQSPTAGNLLVAVVCWYATTAQTLSFTMTAGWTQLLAPFSNNPSGTCHAAIGIYYKVAAGGDAAPAASQTSAGAQYGMTMTIFELAGANTSTPLDTSGIFQSGAASVAFPSPFTVTTAGNVAAAGEFGISCFYQDNGTVTSITWTETGTGWTSAATGGANAGHLQVNYQANPASGAALTDAGHWTSGATTYDVAAVVAVAAAASGTTANAGLAAAAGVPLTPAAQAALNMTIQGI